MKRSEMLRIIWESINELEDAQHLLQRIEKAGMLPPWSEAMKTCDCSLRGSCPGCAPDSYTPRWEPEDE